MGKEKSTKFGELLKDPRWIWAVIVVAVIGFVLLYISEGQFPNMPLSSGIVAFISAVIGVILTIVVTHALLNAQSKKEAEKDRDIRIFQRKIQAYSKFTSNMWKIANDTESKNSNEDNLEEIKSDLFDKLVFFLDKNDVISLTEIIKKDLIRVKDTDDYIVPICKFTEILKNSITDKDNKEKEEPPSWQDFENLCKSFIKDAGTNGATSSETKDEYHSSDTEDRKNTTFWHFNLLGEEQLTAFKNNNWVLNLIEYGKYDENWRTKALWQVRPNDVVFLFRRGGYGYIGAFKVVKNKVLKNEEYTKNKYSEEDIKTYDIYNAMEDGATYSSNLIVEPIAYNYKGVEYLSVRRRTIERMNDMEAVKFLLNRFNGKDLDNNRLAGKGKLDNETSVKLNDNYFSEMIKQCNL